jgi:hypothetical protein
MALSGWPLDLREHVLKVLSPQECDPLVAMLSAKALDDAPSRLARFLFERCPCARLVVGDHECAHGTRARPASTDLHCIADGGGESRTVGRHELFRARQSRERNCLRTVTPKVMAHAAIAANERVDVLQLKPRH